MGTSVVMDLLPSSDSTGIIQYLHEEAPMELERLQSIDQFVSTWPEWGAARGDPCNSVWLRKTSETPPRDADLDGAA